MTPFEKIKIPPVEPNAPKAVRMCPECKARIELPLQLFGKLLECPSCHKGILFERRLDRAKETAGCLGGCLVLLIAFAILTLLSGYLERPPWLYGWSPIVTPPKSNAPPNVVSFPEQAVAAVTAEKKAVTEQRELLEKMVATLPEQNTEVRQQIRNLQSREDELARKQQDLEDLLTELRQKALKQRN